MVSQAKLTPIAGERAITGANRVTLLFAFFAIYVVWGSTYLAIRFAVQTIPPLVVVGVRHSTAGLALFVWAFARGYRPTLREWRASLILGTFYFAVGHGTLHWAETIVPSGMAALLIATEPIWIAVMAALVPGGERLTAKTVGGLVLGIGAVALLMKDAQTSGNGSLIVGSIAILIGALSWAVGVMYSRSSALPKDPVARAGMSALCGSALLLLASVATGEMTHAHPSEFSARSIWALLYLITFGSVIAFTAYTWLLDHCSPTLVSTHTYANPIIAVLLGWGFAGEVLDRRLFASTLLTLLAVFLINRGTGKQELKPRKEADAV